MKYLIDTCVWRDFYEECISQSGRSLFKSAANFFTKILLKKETILYSDALIDELRKDYELQDINAILNLLMLNDILKKIRIEESEYIEAEELSQKRDLPLIDCLNAIQARNHKAIMVSQDHHYFDSLSDIVKIIRP